MLLYRIRAIPFILSKTTCGKGGKLSPAGLKKAKKKTMVFYLGWGWGGCKQTYLDNVTITAEMTSEELFSCV